MPQSSPPESLVELVLYVLAALGIGGGGGAILRDRMAGKGECRAAPCTADEVKTELRRHHESQGRQLAELRSISQAAEVRDATTAEQIRAMTQAVTDTSRSVASLVLALERDRQERERGHA